MRTPISVPELYTCAEKLYVYDVKQEGWEQERNGYEANANHVIKHLAMDLINKDFNDPEKVKTAIAPDSLQYALRLARWADLPPRSLYYTSGGEYLFVKPENVLRIIPRHAAVFAEAAGTLAQNQHDTDHKSTREAAWIAQNNTVRRVARLLIHCADLQADLHDFSLTEAFDARLKVLRKRYKILDPDEIYE